MTKLINTKTNEEIKPGDHVTTFRGVECILRNFRPPYNPSSTGRVGLDNLDGTFYGEFFPAVIDAKITT
jgi:hypothetical protein